MGNLPMVSVLAHIVGTPAIQKCICFIDEYVDPCGVPHSRPSRPCHVTATLMRLVTAYIALGSNLGDRAANLAAAIERLRQTDGVEVTKVATPLENPAVGGPAGSPAFLNSAAEIRTALEPAALLAKLLKIERSLGRVRREKWEARTIDLDLLLYGDEVIREKFLVVPHPLMHERRFVLEPLDEIAPAAVHPALGKTVNQMLAELA
jgi:2-amino-4-hydroxy-6-hydroxymethyldihydropteridine diphosphokinase